MVIFFCMPETGLQIMFSVNYRLRLLSIGSFKLRVFPAHRFSCGSNANSQCKPQDLNHLKWVRTSLLYSLEQRFRFLCWQVQDYRELQDLKLARWEAIHLLWKNEVLGSKQHSLFFWLGKFWAVVSFFLVIDCCAVLTTSRLLRPLV